MKNLIIIFGVALILLAFVSASSQGTEEIETTETIGDIELEINENGIAAVTQNMELLAQETIYQADITIPKAKAESVEISDLNGKLEYDSIIADNEEIINFYFSKPLNAGEKRNITIKYSTEFFTNKQGDTWELSFFLPASNKSAIKVKFTENVIISFTSSEAVPSTYIEDGRQILELEPEGDEIDFLCEYKFKEIEIDTQTNQTVNETIEQEPEIPEFTKEPEGGNYVLIIFTIIIILVALMYLMYYFKFKKLKKPDIEEKEEIKKSKELKKVKPAIFRVLNEDEKKVVEILQSEEDEITQAYIHKSTQIPRSTLSKLMFRLEERNIIERRSEGKTKWIKLKEWVFD